MVMMFISCGRSGRSDTSAMMQVDSVANVYYAGIYSDPARAEAGLTSLRAEMPDSDKYHALSTMIALARLLQGDPAGSDSIMKDVASFVGRNPRAGYARERLASSTGVIRSLYGLNDVAVDDFMLAAEIARQNGNWYMAIKNLANVGEMRELLGDPAGAVGYLRKAIVLADSTGHTEQDFSIRTRLAATYTSMGNFSEADRLFERNDAEAGAMSPTDRFFYFSGKGNSFYYRNDYGRSLQNFMLAAAELPSINDPYMDAVTHSNIGECYMYLGRLDSARHYIELADKEFRDMAVTDINQRFYLNSLRGDLEMRSGNHDLARRLLLSVDPDSVDVTPRYEALHHHRLQNFYAAEGDYRRSLENLLKADAIDDSLQRLIARNYSAEVDNRYLQDTTILHTRLRMAQKEEEISMLYVWIFGAVAAAAVIIFGLLVYLFYHRRKAARELENMRNSLLGMRLENARNRISPHFIFNLLNDELPGDNVRVRNLVKLMRMNLELCNSQTISLEEELHFIDVYMDLVKPSLGPGFRFEKIIDDSVDYTTCYAPAMILQIFIENAVKHGLMGYSDTDKRLTLSLVRDGDALLVTVANTAPAGHRPSAPGTGTGLRVVTQTIAALNARNRNQIELRQNVENLPDGHSLFSISLRLPFDFDYSIPSK